MGIDNLLPSLKSCMDPMHIKHYQGKRVGVDAYAWLHRGAYTCSQELCLGQPTTKWLTWCMSRCRMLLELGVQLVMVFDGGRLPRKDVTEHGRKSAREKNRTLAIELLHSGERDAAYKMFQKAVDITPALARTFITELRKLRGVECIVAPYEADAQLAYLSHKDLIHAVITEDSDLITFGAKRILYKMDGSGQGMEFRLRNLDANTDLRFSGWDHNMFQQMCIMAGCDYLNSIPGIGIKKAYTFIHQHRSWEKALRRVRLDGKVSVPAGYERDFELALLTFKHQRVFDPLLRKMVHLTEPPPGFAEKFPDSSFLGPALPDEIACGIAEGLLDPETHQPFVVAPQPALAAAAAAAGGGASTVAAHVNYKAPERVMDGALPGFVKKHSTAAHHTAQQSISALFPRHPHQFAAAAAAAAAAASSHAHAAASSAAAPAASHTLGSPPLSLSEKQQKIYSVVGALLDQHPDVANVPISSEVRQEFRPPRRSQPPPPPPACRDVTNTFASASQPERTPNKHPSFTFTQLRQPGTYPPKAGVSRASERIDMLERFAFGSSSGSGSGSRGRFVSAVASATFASNMDEEGAEGDEYGFSREEEEAQAELELEAQQEEHQQQQEEEGAAAPVRIPPRRPNFLQRSSTGGSGGPVTIPPPRSAPTSASANANRSAFFSPPSDAFSPPAQSASPNPPLAQSLSHLREPLHPSPSPSPSPPPVAASAHSTLTSSKYFAATRAPLVRLRHPPPAAPAAPAASSSSFARPHVPDATSFLHGPPGPGTVIRALSGPPRTLSGPGDQGDSGSSDDVSPSAAAEEDDDEGRISDLEMVDSAGEEKEEATVVPSRGRSRAATSRKRARAVPGLFAPASASMTGSDLAKRFRSPLVGSSRMTLPLNPPATPPPQPLCARINFDQFKRTPSSGGGSGDKQRHVAAAEAIVLDDDDGAAASPSPPPMVLASSAAVAQPFRPLTVTAGTRAAAAGFTIPPARPPPQRYDYSLGYTSPPSDADGDEDVDAEICPETPPSPSPSPRDDPTPSPPPPPVSQPYVEHAAAGFSSQPEDLDEDEYLEHEVATGAPAAPIALERDSALSITLPAPRAPCVSSFSFFDQFRYQPAAAAPRLASQISS